MSRLTTKDRGQLDAFIGQCLDPLPDTVLVDTALNSLLRQARKDGWRVAQIRVDYWDARILYLRAHAMYVREIEHNPKLADAYEKPDWEYVGYLRKAVAKAILTPAPTMAAVAWKRSQMASGQWPYIPLDDPAALAAIADDEAFLAAHPTTRRPRRPRRAA
jgi:hypothetical protein